jgi:hypothetical protein
MVTIDCPWCDEPMLVDDGDAVRCDGCRLELAFAPDQPAVDVAKAA